MRRLTIGSFDDEQKNFRGRRASIGNSILNRTGSIHDTSSSAERNVRSKQHQSESIRRIVCFMETSGFPGDNLSKVLLSPSFKEFQSIFLIIFGRIDPNYSSSRKFEDEVVVILKFLRYPYMNEINRSKLASVSSPHTWPVLLAMLAWLVDVAEQVQYVEEEKGVDSLFYNFIARQYVSTASGGSGEECEAEFEKELEDMLSAHRSVIEKNNRAAALLGEEISKIAEYGSAIFEMETRIATLKKDVHEITTYIRQTEAKIPKYKKICEIQTGEIATMKKRRNDLEEEMNRLQEELAKQNSGSIDIDAMNKEQAAVLRILEDVRNCKKTHLDKCHGNEEKLNEAVETAEKLVNEYQRMHDIPGELEVIKIVQEDPEKSREWSNYFTDECYIRGDVDKIYTAELEKAEKTKDAILDVEKELSRVKEEHTMLDMGKRQLEEQIARLKVQIERQGEFYVKKLDMFNTEEKKRQQMIDKMEDDFLKLRIDNNNALLSDEQHIQSLQIALKTAEHRIEIETTDMSKMVFFLYSRIEEQLDKLNGSLTEINQMLSDGKHKI